MKTLLAVGTKRKCKAATDSFVGFRTPNKHGQTFHNRFELLTPEVTVYYTVLTTPSLEVIRLLQ